MSMHQDDYRNKATETGKRLFANFADDLTENCIIAVVCLVLGRLGFPWLF